jgi:hypothetical protein
LKIEHQRTERLAVGVGRERAHDAPAKRALKRETERADIGHFVSPDRCGRDASKMRSDPRRDQTLGQQRMVLLIDRRRRPACIQI